MIVPQRERLRHVLRDLGYSDEEISKALHRSWKDVLVAAAIMIGIAILAAIAVFWRG